MCALQEISYFFSCEITIYCLLQSANLYYFQGDDWAAAPVTGTGDDWGGAADGPNW